MSETDEDLDLMVEEYEQKARGSASVTVPLSVPITVDGVEATTLTLHRLKARDVKEMQNSVKGGDAEKALFLLSRMARCNPRDLEQLDLADMDVCEAVLVGFRSRRMA